MFVEFIFVVDILPPMKLLNGKEKMAPVCRVDVKNSEAQRMASEDVEVHGCGRGVYVNSQHPSVTSPCAVAVSVCFLKEWTWMEEPAYW